VLLLLLLLTQRLRFVGRLLQYRSSKRTCVWRVFSKSNYSQFTTSHGEGLVCLHAGDDSGLAQPS
jgi:hypothetical protein